ncbi:hypothetical protein KQY27_02680 [Methanobrevibacter sp. TMH8]|uniref:hypothetical protein n=1 Tax=Methanobrevibacter sp. TMH8 TaxID=2848611 RepID=UPI001CCEF893|nr:hypothetical protein [Methanobrevibacter sp. TMH8]MBZ9570450.1 hypothetical protein [Methanobrevibacter sp. TMH8]
MGLFSFFHEFHESDKLKNNWFKKTFQILKSYNTIKKNNLLDEKEYLLKYPDIKKLNPIIHYIYFGHDEGRYTNNTLNIKKFLSSNENFLNSGLNPLVYVALYENNNMMTPSFDSLNLTLEGNDDFLFLINDSNNEIKQHFDDLYPNNFNPKVFKDNFSFKTFFFNEMNIKYYFFIFPDKSLVCKKKLPFDFNNTYRIYDQINDLFPDFIDSLDEEDYFKHDTHISYKGGEKLALNF